MIALNKKNQSVKVRLYSKLNNQLIYVPTFIGTLKEVKGNSQNQEYEIENKEELNTQKKRRKALFDKRDW